MRRGVQHAGESLQEFAVAIDHLVHLACVESAEHHVSRETDLAFADVVREGDLRRQLLLEGRPSVRPSRQRM
jgi:hypothetical protein